ncbi:hypothetical protein [Aurantiacibacter flavus]|uniref:Uncharacterized protein n=1 Tax=Aurantiacibacter flavus TaxID=3145232 RepID=A0ABV0CWG2_9SPHN
MGPNSSSAALRSEDAFGSLASMGARKLKKKPVLVVDPDELAQAHQLFQQGAAEQMGEYEPVQRPRAAVSLFGLAPMSDDDGDDAFVPGRSPFNDDDEDEVLEADAPAPDQVLALTRPRAPRAPKTNLFGTLPDAPMQDPAASAPSQATPPLQGADQPKPVEPQLAPPVAPSEPDTPKPRLIRDYEDIGPGFSLREPAPSLPKAVMPQRARAPIDAPKPTERTAIDDGVASIIHFEDEDAHRPAPTPLEPAPSAQSRLRARLVREDVCLSQPRPSRWQRVVSLVQRLYWTLTGR